MTRTTLTTATTTATTARIAIAVTSPRRPDVEADKAVRSDWTVPMSPERSVMSCSSRVARASRSASNHAVDGRIRNGLRRTVGTAAACPVTTVMISKLPSRRVSVWVDGISTR